MIVMPSMCGPLTQGRPAVPGKAWFPRFLASYVSLPVRYGAIRFVEELRGLLQPQFSLQLSHLIA